MSLGAPQPVGPEYRNLFSTRAENSTFPSPDSFRVSEELDVKLWRAASFYAHPGSATDHVAESGRPGRPELLARKGGIVGGVGCPPNCRTSGKPRGSSDLLELFRKMLHFWKNPEKKWLNLVKI